MAWAGSTLIAAALFAGCGGSSGVHTQSLSPTLNTFATRASVTSTPPAATSTPFVVTPTLTTSVPTISGVRKPTVTPSAQSAVDAYIDFYNASGAADRDPARADIAALDVYLTGKAKTLFDSNYASMKTSGLAYRGTAPNPRLKVQQVFSATSVFLESCPLESPIDPYVEYTVSTGKPVPAGAKRSPPPPYLLILPMVKVGDQWKLSDVLPNTSKTCTA
jgi:hypothetical protein